MRLIAGVLAIALVLLPGSAPAATLYDPEVAYFTLTTPHFFIVYPAGYEHIALRSGRIAESTLPRLVKRYGWVPAGRTTIVINDETDEANGYALVLPNKLITVYVTAPTEISGLEDYDDWLANVLTHEMTHIVHLDMAYGLPWLGRLLLGKYVSMNMYTPDWITEGLAVYEETISSGSGRGRSAYVDMVIRTAALADRFPSIDQGYRGFPKWPFSYVAYFFGGRFQLWIAEHYGEDKLLQYHRTYAANPIPYFTWMAAELTFDTSLESLWAAFFEDMKADGNLTVEALRRSPLPITAPTRLTRYGGDLTGPRVTPDGKWIIFSARSPVDGDRVRRIDTTGAHDEPLINDTFSKAVSFSPDGSALYYQQREINQRYYTHNNLLRYDLIKDTTDRMRIPKKEEAGFLAPSGSMRARDPEISPDGKHIVFVQTPYASNRLVLADLDPDGLTIHPRVIVPAEPDVQLADPRFSPDGKLIAASRFKSGRRDVVLFDTDGNVVEEVTRDRSVDIDPSWSPDGRWLIFASDRTGIYDLYGYEIATRRLVQLTNLETGAFQPCLTPDGKRIVFRGYSADGFDVYTVPFLPERGLEVERALEPIEDRDTSARRWPPRTGSLPEIPPPAPFTGTPLPKDLPKDWSIKPYSALDTVLPFHDNWNLIPTGGLTEREAFGQLTTIGVDALGTQSYIINGTYSTLSKFVGGAANYNNDMFEPTFSLLGAADARIFSQTVYVPRAPDMVCAFGASPSGRSCYGTEDGLYFQRRLQAEFAIGLPFLQRHFFSIAYNYQHRDSLDQLPTGTRYDLLPASGRFARVSLGYAYNNVRLFPYSVSLERGTSFNVALQGLSRGLGGDYEAFVLSTQGRFYLSLPWNFGPIHNHVLGARVAVAVSGGPDAQAEKFQLGGVGTVSAVTTTTDNFFPLRGLDTGVLTGVGVLSTSIEYRAPIFRLDHGPGTLPLTLSVLHGAIFADLGRVFDKIDWDSIHQGFFKPFAVGLGAELRGDITFAYGLPLTLVAGAAYAVRTPAPGLRAPQAYYFTLGSSF
jgi:Tol biopolymer transport system component